LYICNGFNEMLDLMSDLSETFRKFAFIKFTPTKFAN